MSLGQLADSLSGGPEAWTETETLVSGQRWPIRPVLPTAPASQREPARLDYLAREPVPRVADLSRLGRELGSADREMPRREVGLFLPITKGPRQ